MKLILAVLMMVFGAAVHADTLVQFTGAQADEIKADLGLNSDTPATIHLEGYLTERAHPPVKYTALTVTIQGQTTTPSLGDDEKTNLGELFQSAGIDPGVIAGGTTYLFYDLSVQCSAGQCTVH